LIGEEFYDNLLNSGHSTLFDPVKEDKVTFIIPNSNKLEENHFSPIEWLLRNQSTDYFRERAKLRSEWIKIEPKNFQFYVKYVDS
jgi:hypothetical protein